MNAELEFQSPFRKMKARAATLAVRLRELAPYALIELLLPGGSMIAILLWLYRRKGTGH